jgi:hypothetical protein
LKEEVEAAFQSPSSSESSSSGSSSDSDDSKSDGSDFGFGQSGKTSPKRRVRGKTTVAARPKEKATASTPKDKTPSTSPREDVKTQLGRKGKQAAEPPKLTEALQVVKSLEQISVPTIWKGTVKPKEVNGRISRAVSFASELVLEAIGMTDVHKEQAEKVASDLNEQANSITLMMEITDRLQSAGVVSVLYDEALANNFKHVASTLHIDAVTLSTIFTHVGQKIMEACFWNVGAQLISCVFFQFGIV